MIDDNEKYHVRYWLNAENGLAAIEAMVARSHARSITADIDISDCNRSILLDFGVWDKAGIPAVRSKIDLLVTTLIDFRAALDVELTDLAALPDDDYCPRCASVYKTRFDQDQGCSSTNHATWHEELAEPEILAKQ